MSKKKRRKHSDEFKREAVRLAKTSGKPLTQIARELDISDSLLHDWIRKADEAEQQGLTVDEIRAEQKQLAEQRREIARLKQENELLKKAAAYFAKESI